MPKRFLLFAIHLMLRRFFPLLTMILNALKKGLHGLLRCFTLRGLFIANCLVLFVNLVFYVLNTHHGINGSWSWWPPEAYFISPLDENDRHLLDRVLRVFVEAVEAANLTYIICGGTLIGSLRHHGRIPWDDDVDVMFSTKDKARLTEVLSQFDPEFGLYVTGSDSHHSQWKFYPTAGHFIIHRQYRTPYIDIFFYQENETHLWNAHPIWTRTERWPKRYIFPLRRRPYGDLALMSPCNGLVVIATSANLSECRGRDFNHMLELPMLSRPVSVPCERLSHLYPFVRRRTAQNGSTQIVRESLMFGNWSIKDVEFPQFCH